MKKGLFILLIIILGYALVTRFIDFPTHQLENVTKANCGPSSLYPCEVLESIDQEYENKVQPIFAQKCLMCHGLVERMPIYAKVPPSSWLVAHDIEEAKEHLNMYPGFLLDGKQELSDIIDEIREVIEENSMPPIVYLVMHWNSRLTDAEKETILTWLRNSEGKI